MMEVHAANGAVATVAVEEVSRERTKDYGMVRASEVTDEDDESFALDDIVDHPEPEEAPSQWALAARYVFGPEIFSAIHRTRPAWGGETHLTDALRILLQQGHRVQALKLLPSQARHDIGSFEGYFRTFLDFALMDPLFGERARDYLQEACARQPEWQIED